MEKPPQTRFLEQIAVSKSALLDLEEAARYWANKTKDKQLRSNLYQVEREARWLWYHVKALAPPAGE